MKSLPAILVLGGNRYNVASIRSMKDAGFTVVVADRNPVAPGLEVADTGLAVDVTDSEGLMSAVRRLGGVDGVMSMAEAGVRTAAHLAARLGLPAISEDAASAATSKAEMRRRWSKLGKWSPPFCVVSSVEEAKDAASPGFLPAVFKPDRSHGGSRGVSIVEDARDVEAAYTFAVSNGLPGTEVIIESLLTGTEHSCEVLIWDGKAEVLCIGQKVKSREPYRVDVSVQYPADLTPQQESDIKRMVQESTAALGLAAGVAHVEFACTPDGPMLFELGARCGGGHTPQIVKHVCGVDEVVEACRMACGIPPEVTVPTARRGADYRFLVFPPGRVAAVIAPDEPPNESFVLDMGATLRSGDEIGVLRTASDRGGFIVSLGETREDAVRNADRLLNEFWVRYEDGSCEKARTLDELIGKEPSWKTGGS